MQNVYPVKNLSRPLDLKLTVPGSKSLTNRAFLIAMLANGTSRLSGALESDDTDYMQKALQQLSIQVEKKNSGEFVIHGNAGIFSNHEPLELFLGNAGTAVRFLTAAMSLREGQTIITGDERMQARPIQPLIDGLKQAGVQIRSLKNNGNPPLEISGKTLAGGEITIPGEISSQYFSAILLSAPYSKNPITLKVQSELASKPYLNLTLDLMKKFGIQVKHEGYQTFEIPQGIYQAQDYQIEGDASSSSYFFALAALHGGKIKIKNLTLASQQGDLKLLDFLKEMLKGKAEIKDSADGIEFIVPAPPTLKGLGKIDLNDLPDAAMTLAMVAACAEGETILSDIANLRIKETNRLAALVTELNKIGIQARELSDGLAITGYGKNPPQATAPIEIETYNDHRMAMCFAVLGTKIPNITIQNPACVNKTYPHFWEDLEKVY